MWFPTNKPRFDGRNQQQNNNTTPAFTGRNTCCNHRFPTGTPHRAGCGARVTAVIAWGKRPVPFRTRKLRPTAPMVLHPGGCGRVGHRRNIIQARPRTRKCPGPDPFKHPTQTPAPQGRRLTAKPQPAAIGHPKPSGSICSDYPHALPAHAGNPRTLWHQGHQPRPHGRQPAPPTNQPPSGVPEDRLNCQSVRRNSTSTARASAPALQELPERRVGECEDSHGDGPGSDSCYGTLCSRLELTSDVRTSKRLISGYVG